MRIGVVGAGRVGAGLAGMLGRAGHQAMLSYSRDAAKLERTAREAGARHGTPAEAASFGDAILFAPPSSAIEDAIEACGDLSGKVLIDCTNDLRREPGSLSSAQRIASQVNASVVKAFNTVFAALYDEIEATETRPDMLYCGDDLDVKRTAAEVISSAGFEPIDAGPLATAVALEDFAALVISLCYERGRGPFVFQFRRPADLGT